MWELMLWGTPLPFTWDGLLQQPMLILEWYSSFGGELNTKLSLSSSGLWLHSAQLVLLFSMFIVKSLEDFSHVSAYGYLSLGPLLELESLHMHASMVMDNFVDVRRKEWLMNYSIYSQFILPDISLNISLNIFL